MATKTLILGGGVGGIVTANTLRALLPKDHEITVVERRKTFNIGAAKTWVMLGQKRVEEIVRPVAALKSRGIQVLEDAVEKIDPAKREVKTSTATLTADYLVVALGADLNPALVPGLDRAETFYTLDGAVRLGAILKDFKGGEVVILNPRMPIKCPPAPYEVAFLLDHEFTNSGIREKSKITVCTVEGIPMATAGPKVGGVIRDELAKRNIPFLTGRKTKAVDADRKAVVFEDGTELKYDLLITVPPHEVPKVVREAGLAKEGGWIPVDPKTLKTSVERVWAIGDATTVPLPGRFKPDVPLVLPKAAVFADAHGRVVASQIAAHARGHESAEAFEGKGMCYVEFGGHHAMGGQGDFFAMPAPNVATKAPDLMTFEEKQAWAAGFLERNF
jgi:sulfide:quinone oxidoreductase